MGENNSKSTEANNNTNNNSTNNNTNNNNNSTANSPSPLKRMVQSLSRSQIFQRKETSAFFSRIRKEAFNLSEAKIRECFQLYDKNGNGSIDREELRLLLRDLFDAKNNSNRRQSRNNNTENRTSGT